MTTRAIPMSFFCRRTHLYRLQQDHSLSLEDSDLKILSTEEPEIVEIIPRTMRGASALIQLSSIERQPL